MGKIRRSATDLDNIEYPKTLYKYRGWTSTTHKRILTHQEVFFAPPSSFEDPLDCKFPIRWDLLTDRQIFQRYFDESLKRNPQFKFQQHHEFALHWSLNSPVKQEKHLKEMSEYQRVEFDKRIGILSLTENPNNEIMWNYYSENESGICVGLDSRMIFEQFGGGGDVVYVDEVPIILPMPFHSFEKQNHLQVFNKLDKWSFEQEYRTFIFDKNMLSNETRKRVLPKKAIKEIRLGSKISNKARDEIYAIVEKELNHIKLI